MAGRVKGAKPKAGAAWKEKQRRAGGRRQTGASVGSGVLKPAGLVKTLTWSGGVLGPRFQIITLVELWSGGCKFSKRGMQ
jgi:hypothetical protein